MKNSQLTGMSINPPTVQIEEKALPQKRLRDIFYDKINISTDSIDKAIGIIAAVLAAVIIYSVFS